MLSNLSDYFIVLTLKNVGIIAVLLSVCNLHFYLKNHISYWKGINAGIEIFILIL